MSARKSQELTEHYEAAQALAREAVTRDDHLIVMTFGDEGVTIADVASAGTVAIAALVLMVRARERHRIQPMDPEIITKVDAALRGIGLDPDRLPGPSLERDPPSNPGDQP